MIRIKSPETLIHNGIKWHVIMTRWPNRYETGKTLTLKRYGGKLGDGGETIEVKECDILGDASNRKTAGDVEQRSEGCTSPTIRDCFGDPIEIRGYHPHLVKNS